MKFKKYLVVVLVFVALLPARTFAHEVYVLGHDQIVHDLAQPAVNLFQIAEESGGQFILWSIIGALIIFLVLGISISRKVEKKIDPFLFKIKPYAGHVAQVTLGLALLASAYYGALFGTELPFANVFGASTFVVTFLLYVASFSILFGVYERLGGLLAIIIYLSALSSVGGYLASYLVYLGEAFVIFLFGGGYSLVKNKFEFLNNKIKKYLDRRKFFIVRACFSVSILYAAIYAKLLHGSLAFDTVNTYHLTNYFHFSPAFIVLGAFLIEFSIGLFILLGFEIRFISFVFLAFLTLSLCFFGEVVWPHIVLLGTNIVLFLHGYDEFTVFHHLYKKNRREPVL